MNLEQKTELSNKVASDFSSKELKYQNEILQLFIAEFEIENEFELEILNKIFTQDISMEYFIDSIKKSK